MQPPDMLQLAKIPMPTGPPDEEPEDPPEDEPEDDPEEDPEDDPEDEPEDDPEDDPEDEPEDDDPEEDPEEDPEDDPEDEVPDDEPEDDDPEDDDPEEDPDEEPEPDALASSPVVSSPVELSEQAPTDGATASPKAQAINENLVIGKASRLRGAICATASTQTRAVFWHTRRGGHLRQNFFLTTCCANRVMRFTL
jgi:hypothetical protein